MYSSESDPIKPSKLYHYSMYSKSYYLVWFISFLIFSFPLCSSELSNDGSHPEAQALSSRPFATKTQTQLGVRALHSWAAGCTSKFTLVKTNSIFSIFTFLVTKTLSHIISKFILCLGSLFNSKLNLRISWRW